MSKDFVSSLTPQTLLRQLSCGVIFFLPIILFSPRLLSGNTCLCKLSVEVVALCGFVAYVFGTIIYHLEKNLYSYGVQFLFSLVPYSNRDLRKRIFYFLGSSPIIIALLVILFGPSFVLFKATIILILMMWASIAALIGQEREDLPFLSNVRRIWTLEENPDQNKFCCSCRNAHVSASAISHKLARWSDFIHCGQSCALAWLLGAFVAYHFGAPCCCSENDCICYLCPVDSELYLWSLFAAVLLLLFELLIDWHRYQHVMWLLSSNFKEMS